MIRSSLKTTLVGLSLIALTLTGLTACSGDADAKGDSDMTLAQTKSPAQLLRNEAASRIPEALIEEIAQSTDKSTACETVEQDPEGLLRKWDSTVRVVLTEKAGSNVDSIVEDLVTSFVVRGWTRGSQGGSIVKLTSDTSPASIHVSLVEANEEKATNAVVQLKASGPCVMTGGTDSSEVVNLEERE
ncbi:MAG: hypothetical protein ACOH1T_10100 [Microbacteriaceae bacterium]